MIPEPCPKCGMSRCTAGQYFCQPPRIRESVKTLVRSAQQGAGRISYEEWEAIHLSMSGLNSWEKEAIYPHLDNDALIQVVEYSISNSRQPSGPEGRPATYDEAVIHLFAPLLIERLKEARRD